MVPIARKGVKDKKNRDREDKSVKKTTKITLCRAEKGKKDNYYLLHPLHGELNGSYS